MKKRELGNLGVPRNTMRTTGLAVQAALAAGMTKNQVREAVKKLIVNPKIYFDHKHFDKLAREILSGVESQALFTPRKSPAPYRQWGEDIDETSIDQMKHACDLPISVRGALMPDAHVGYGLPIGGVLATRNAVIPYAVGVDIACRMKMTVLDLPVTAIERQKDRLENAIREETRFGIGSHFESRRDHDVLDEDWSVTEITRGLKDKAWAQLGSSGGGNHFVEFGTLTLGAEFGLKDGIYMALLSHSGSRGAGATVANHYSRLAMELHPELPKELAQLAWLDLQTEAGQEYWEAMELMGKYAAANHACIHDAIAKNLGAHVLFYLENHHNFAWKEEYDGEELIVHRKGATPAGFGTLGIIPGSMASPGYIVRGKGNLDSLNSASHGAGRRMSRKKAKESFTWSAARKLLAERKVSLMSAGLDEVPMAYKDIDVVMAAQSDLVETLGRFDPRLVRMAAPEERTRKIRSKRDSAGRTVSRRE